MTSSHLRRRRKSEMRRPRSIRSATSATCIGSGQYDKALDYDQQALAAAQKIGDAAGVEKCLGDIGIVNDDLAHYDKALEYEQRGLAAARKIGDAELERAELCNIGSVYADLGQYDKALDYDQRALTAAQKLGNAAGVETDLGNIGCIYANLGQYDKALASYSEALVGALTIGDRSSTAKWFSDIMHAYEDLKRPGPAILYGKQAVDQYQEVRRDVANMAKESQASYLAGISPWYRKLADLLIGQGRLSEAQQVLHMLKEQQYFDYIHPDLKENNGGPQGVTLDTAEPTLHEARWNARLDAATKAIGDLGSQIAALSEEKERPAADQAKLAALQEQMGQDTTAYDELTKAIGADISGPAGPGDRLPIPLTRPTCARACCRGRSPSTRSCSTTKSPRSSSPMASPPSRATPQR